MFLKVPGLQNERVWWRFMVVGDGWQWLAVGGWSLLAVGDWRLVAVGGWRLVVPWGGP